MHFRRGTAVAAAGVEALEVRALLSAVAAPQVVARHVFYDNSVYDRRGGRHVAAGQRDAAAIARDKVALLPGQAPSAANYTSYGRGINGIMIDVAGLPPGATIGAAALSFRVGNDGNPSTWPAGPAPRAISVASSLDADGNTVGRITISWRGRAIRNTWLQVTLHANADTGLAAPDVFYFGNLAGDAGAGDGVVNDVDVSAVASHLSRRAAVDDPYDIDRSGRVTRADVRVARRNLGAALYVASPFAEETDVIQPPPLPGAWRSIFRDEFDGSSLAPVWHPAQYWDHDLTVVGDGELQAYDPTGVSVSDGVLRLAARRDDRHGVPYVSGLVMTGGEKALPQSPRFSFLYGYLEVRAKLPAGRGLWPAVWMMPASYDDDAGEIDGVEVFGQKPSEAHFTVHRGHPQEGHEWAGPEFSDDFHTFAVDWQPDHVSWYVDGVERARTSRAELICREAMYPILNLAVGGAAGAPDVSTPLPAEMQVDYVWVWQQGEL